MISHWCYHFVFILLVQSILFIIILLILLLLLLLLLLDYFLLLICSSLSMLVCFLFFEGVHNCYFLLLLLNNLFSLVSFTPRHPTGRIRGGLLICQYVRMLLSLLINHLSISVLVQLSGTFLICLWHFHPHNLGESTVTTSETFK